MTATSANMIRSVPNLTPGDLIEWADGERARVTWVSTCGQFFRVAGLHTRLRATDAFTVISVRVDVPP